MNCAEVWCNRRLLIDLFHLVMDHDFDITPLAPSTSALAAFDAVARHESFSAAAEELSLTQGAVSRQIATLEEQLGTALFDRTSRNVVLSDAGRVYLKAVGPALASIRAASLQVMSHMRGTTLNLAFLPTFGTRWLIPRIPRFVAKYPDIILNFATRIGQFDFDREGLDAAIHIGQPDWPNADSVFLMDETVAPVCSPAFLQQNPVHVPADLLPLPYSIWLHAPVHGTTGSRASISRLRFHRECALNSFRMSHRLALQALALR